MGSGGWRHYRPVLLDSRLDATPPGAPYACLLLCAAATLHKAHGDAALFRNAMNFTTDVRPPLAASDKLRACTGLVDQPNRQMMQASPTDLAPMGHPHPSPAASRPRARKKKKHKRDEQDILWSV